MQQQLQGLLPHKFAFAHKRFWEQKTGKVPWTNKPHNRLRETSTQFPIWDSYWDIIPKGHPRGLSKQGSGPSYHLWQQILACFGAILKWQADRRQGCSNILHLKSSPKIQLGNFSSFLITLFHVQRKSTENITANIKSHYKRPVLRKEHDKSQHSL